MHPPVPEVLVVTPEEPPAKPEDVLVTPAPPRPDEVLLVTPAPPRPDEVLLVTPAPPRPDEVLLVVVPVIPLVLEDEGVPVPPVPRPIESVPVAQLTARATPQSKGTRIEESLMAVTIVAGFGVERNFDDVGRGAT